MATRPRTPHDASRRPSRPPTADSSTLSRSSRRTTCQRLAPSATRIVISRARSDARASSRLPTFAQEISSTSATAAVSTRSTGRTLPTSRRAAGRARPWRSPTPDPRGRGPARSWTCCGLRLRQRDPRLQLAHDAQHDHPARRLFRVDADGREDVGIDDRRPERRRHDPDDGHGLAVEQDRSADERGIGPEPSRPQARGRRRPRAPPPAGHRPRRRLDRASAGRRARRSSRATRPRRAAARARRCPSGSASILAPPPDARRPSPGVAIRRRAPATPTRAPGRRAPACPARPSPAARDRRRAAASAARPRRC